MGVVGQIALTFYENGRNQHFYVHTPQTGLSLSVKIEGMITFGKQIQVCKHAINIFFTSTAG